MLILNASQVRDTLPMKKAIRGMKQAYAAFSDGKAKVPLRNQLAIPDYEAVNLFMPAYLQTDELESLAIKIVGVYPQNIRQGIPLIHASVMVVDASTGRPLAMVEGASLTAIRTGAASGAATDLLAREDCRIAAIFGAGIQGRTQLEAVCAVRPIERAWVFDPNPERTQTFIESAATWLVTPIELMMANSPHQALAEADIVCTATTSKTPVFSDSDLKPGVHINGIGSYTPEMQEIPTETIRRARIFVDSRDAAFAEAGDLIQPIQSGVLSEDAIAGEIGEVILERQVGRQSRNQITFFKSVGLAVQDVIAAHLAIETAQREGFGLEVELD